jgi:hypothetical protein
MANNVITIQAEDTVVREDTAKSYRGVIWGLTTTAICLAIMAAFFIGLFLMSPKDTIPADPTGTQESGGQ